MEFVVEQDVSVAPAQLPQINDLVVHRQHMVIYRANDVEHIVSLLVDITHHHGAVLVVRQGLPLVELGLHPGTEMVVDGLLYVDVPIHDLVYIDQGTQIDRVLKLHGKAVTLFHGVAGNQIT